MIVCGEREATYRLRVSVLEDIVLMTMMSRVLAAGQSTREGARELFVLCDGILLNIFLPVYKNDEQSTRRRFAFVSSAPCWSDVALLSAR